MSLHVEIQSALSDVGAVPDVNRISSWAQSAWDGRSEQAEMVVRVTDADEITALNSQFRGKDTSTNVLSFPVGELDEEGVNYLGDVVVCAEVVVQEAAEQAKSPESHWAHMVIHGTLHLLGYDHQTAEEAERMETLEIDIMQRLGYSNPYQCESP